MTNRLNMYKGLKHDNVYFSLMVTVHEDISILWVVLSTQWFRNPSSFIMWLQHPLGSTRSSAECPQKREEKERFKKTSPLPKSLSSEVTHLLLTAHLSWKGRVQSLVGGLGWPASQLYLRNHEAESRRNLWKTYRVLEWLTSCGIGN